MELSDVTDKSLKSCLKKIKGKIPELTILQKNHV